MPAAEIMRKFKAGTLKSGSGHPVTNPAQARAIAASYGKKEHRSPMPHDSDYGGGLPRSLRMDTEEDRKADRKAAKASAKKASKKGEGRVARALDSLKMFTETMAPLSEQHGQQRNFDRNRKATAAKRRESAVKTRSNRDTEGFSASRRRQYDKVED
jgi:hypothetical protein